MAQIESIGAASRPRAAVARRGVTRRLDALGDSDLLAFVSRRDHEALAVIYDRQIDSVWKVALYYSESRAAAEEAVFAVFLDLWRKPGADDGTSLSARLLAGVAREAQRQPATGAQA